MYISYKDSLLHPGPTQGPWHRPCSTSVRHAAHGRSTSVGRNGDFWRSSMKVALFLPFFSLWANGSSTSVRLFLEQRPRCDAVVARAVVQPSPGESARGAGRSSTPTQCQSRPIGINTWGRVVRGSAGLRSLESSAAAPVHRGGVRAGLRRRRAGRGLLPKVPTAPPGLQRPRPSRPPPLPASSDLDPPDPRLIPSGKRNLRQNPPREYDPHNSQSSEEKPIG